MDVRITPARLSGQVVPPPSKSQSHRLLIAAALACGKSVIKNVAFSQDTEATLRCINALGAKWECGNGELSVCGCGGKGTDGPLPSFDCGESGSTLRFLIPISLAVSGGGTFTGGGRLLERPLGPYADLFQEKGVSFELSANALTVKGRLEAGTYRLPGNVSSQFFTGLLFALPLLGGRSEILSTTEIESSAYIDMTLDALSCAGVDVEATRGETAGFVVPGVPYRPFARTVETDWSQAAFWYAANCLGSTLDIGGLNFRSSQGDRAVSDFAAALSRPGDIDIDLSGCPDLAPPLSVMAAVRNGNTRFYNAARLRLKESDRLYAISKMLSALGVRISEGANSLTVTGAQSLRGCTIDGCGDHRIVMAAAIAATRADGPVTILGAEAVKKSYPDFFADYKKLGGITDVI